MKKQLLGLFVTIFLATSVSGQEASNVGTIDNIEMDEILVISSFANDRFENPVSLSTLNSTSIRNKISNQEFPEILKSTPSIYASKQGGGFGDSRITLRGFSSGNISLLINGIPVNDMENGSLYWSNWAGLADAATSVQVQRGLGLSKLGLYSVGGTVNIITQGSENIAGGWIYSGIGNDNYKKTSFCINTGKNDKNWAMTMLGSRTTGDGFVNGTNFEVWSYYIGITKSFNNQKLTFIALGAPQWHNRRSNKHAVEDYKNHRDGIRMNTSYGYINGEITPTYSGYNEYHKPQLSINHYWHINDHSTLSSSVYVFLHPAVAKEYAVAMPTGYSTTTKQESRTATATLPPTDI